MNQKPNITVRNKFTRVKTARGRKLSSKNWLQRQLNDPYVKQSKVDGYRSRAAYKLVEINQKYNIIEKHSNILDLGSAPGSWSQIATKYDANKIISVDLLEMDAIDGVDFIKGDFLEQETQEEINTLLGGQEVHLILSDIAPNTTGHKDTDQFRIMAVGESLLEFSKLVLAKNGSMVIKIFQGSGFPEYIKELRTIFSKVNTYKPDASRAGSSEIYIIAISKK